MHASRHRVLRRRGLALAVPAAARAGRATRPPSDPGKRLEEAAAGPAAR